MPLHPVRLTLHSLGRWNPRQRGWVLAKVRVSDNLLSSRPERGALAPRVAFEGNANRRPVVERREGEAPAELFDF
jgi:hypothetical protein